MQEKIDFLNNIKSTHNPIKAIGGDNVKYADNKPIRGDHNLFAHK